MGNSAADLQGTFNSEIFPSLALLDENQVAQVRGLANVGNVPSSPFLKMVPDNDERLELESFGVHENFSVVVITQFAESDYEEFLKPMLPLHLFQPIKPEV